MNSTKPLILIFPFNLLSHYVRCFALAKRFLTDCDVRFVQSDEYDHFTLQENFPTFHARQFNSAEVMQAVRKFDFSWLNDRTLESIFESQVDAITQLRPVAVIGDNAPTLKMAAERTGVKYVSVLNGYMSKYYDGVRKLSRTHFAFRLLKNFPRAVATELTKVAERESLKSIHAPFVNIRKKYNLSSADYYPDELEGDENLICDLKALFPQKDLPENYRIIGPLLFSSNRKVGVEEMLSPGKKTLFVSMGSSGEWGKVRFLNEERFACFNIVTAGDKEKVLNNSHIYSFPFIAMNEILPLADAAICHGGNGTIYNALLHEIPVLCFPSYFEQEWNVDAIEHHDLGRDISQIFKSEDFLLAIERCFKLKSSLRSHPIVKKLKEGRDAKLPMDVFFSRSQQKIANG